MDTTPYKIDKSQDYRPRLSVPNNFSALFALILFTCVITFWVWAGGHAREMEYIYIYSRVALGDGYRLFTSGFLHFNKSHLIHNMIWLLIFGLHLCYRTKISNRKFCLFYLSAILFSSYFAHHLYYMHRPFDTTSLGASGGVFAVKFAALLVGLPLTKEKDFNIIIRRLNIILFFGFFFFNVYNKLGTSQADSIAHEAHFGGALYGIGFAFLCYRKLIFGSILANKPTPQKDKVAELHAIESLY